jgi:glutamate/tyrosine decarboxylase-like PLP-dependent enzyme
LPRRSRRRGPEANARSPSCATAGTTVVGSIDPLGAIADIARREGLWFHVDAAYGGTLILSETHRHLLSGIERADSITFNPQKWMYIPKACAMLLVRDLASARRRLHAKAPYTLPALPGAVNLGDHAVQGTRHADALKLWMGLRAFGVTALGALVDAQIARARAFAERVARTPGLEAVDDPEMNIVGWGVARDGDSADSMRNSLPAEAHFEQGAHAVSCPEFRGRRILRTLFLNPYTTDAEVEALIGDAAEALGGENP